MSKYIDFIDPENRYTYVGRDADPEWTAMFERLMQPAGKAIADIGCGGGIYTRAIADVGAQMIVAVDSSHSQMQAVQEACEGLSSIFFAQTDAESMGLRSRSFDGLVERALIHHFDSLAKNFAEAWRVLTVGGRLWVQDRTIADVLRPPSDEHVRGYYLEYDSRLKDTEVERRRERKEVSVALRGAGFSRVETHKVKELRKVFDGPADLKEEIVSRRGRSLLHALDEKELISLADYVVDQIVAWPVHERDLWTVWIATK